ncbi:hypothetical protein PGTUg99_025863 [Puccinia graminis f. sp. tritici]|uniref:Uncharacterized protein n=1 Tax=Puccinia graminis f. sp. tritici TaxID=56615 RepID=A0A5B0MDC0_PUCGR|nr:hypothetical protein PGTUg99_025863 [Puccinia graminis f. sp. tritici]
MRLNIIVLQIALQLFHGRDISTVVAMTTYDGISTLSGAHRAQYAGTQRNEISPVGQALLRNHEESNAKEFLQSSKARFDDLGERITESVNNGHLIYIEDGEGDDHWQSLLGALDQIVPEMVVHRGGYYKVRKDLTEKVWENFHQVAERKKPIISPIHGARPDDRLGVFDKLEGIPEDDPKSGRLEELRHESFNAKELAAEIKKTRQQLLRRLQRNKFTTIVTKCSPTGLAELIVEAKAEKRVAIVWTGFTRFEPKDKSFEVKFNVRKDLEASKALLALNLPTVITTPRLQNSKLGAIVAEEIARVFAPLSRDVEDTYGGFKGLHGLVSPRQGTFGHLLAKSHDLFRNSRIDDSRQDEHTLSELKAKEAMQLEVSNERINKLENTLQFSQGKKWDTIMKAIETERRKAIELNRPELMIPPGAPLRDFCPIDQYAHVILKDSLRKESVKEVITTHVRLSSDNSRFEISPSADSNVHIVTMFDANPLAADIQNSLFYIAHGEPLQRQKYLEIVEAHRHERPRLS